MALSITSAGAVVVVDLFAKSKVQIMLKHPFFATLTAHLPTVERPDWWFDALGCPRTACVDGRRIYFCRGFVQALSDAERIGLLVHEAMHCALQHLWRRGHRDPRLWNYATDYAANDIITNATITVKEGGRTIERRAFTLPKGALYDPRFQGMAAEQIYEILRQEEQASGREHRPDGQGPLDGHIEKPIKGEGEDDGEGEAEAGAGKGSDKGEAAGAGAGGDKGREGGQAGGDSGGGGGGQGGQAPQGGRTDIKAEDFDERIQDEWKQITEQAKVTARQAGKLPGNLARMVDEIVDSRIPWQTYLDYLISKYVKRDDYDMQVADRRFMEIGMRLPDLYSEACQLVLLFDVSGSIGQKEMRAMLGEAHGIARCRGVDSLRIMACDTRVTMDVVVGPYDELPTTFPGGGGTSLIPPFERLAEDPGAERPSLIVYFTDLVAGQNVPTDDPGIPTMWLWLRPAFVTEEYCSKPTFGHVVEYDPMTDEPYGRAA